MRLIREKTKFFVTDLKREDKYPYKSYTRDNDLGSRHYNVDDKKIPSVTTILSATQSPEKKASLDRWRERIGYAEAQAITTQAATRGTEMHYVLENYINGVGYLNLSEKGAKLAYKDRWAGSTDLVGLHDGKPSIIDFKQSNKPKREEYIEDYYLQISAYSLAHKEQYGPIEQGVISICTKDGLYQEFKMDESKLKEYEEKWLEKVEKYHLNKSVKATS